MKSKNITKESFFRSLIESKSYKIKKTLYNGNYGNTYVLCVKDNCKYLGKLMLDSGSKNEENDWLNEFKISKLMDKLGVGPHIHEMGIEECPNNIPHGFIIMDLYETDLLEYLHNNKINVDKKINIINYIETLLKTMNVNDVLHCDLKLQNIVINNADNNNFEIKIIDYGIAIEKNNENFMIRYPSIFHYSTSLPEYKVVLDDYLENNNESSIKCKQYDCYKKGDELSFEAMKLMIINS